MKEWRCSACVRVIFTVEPRDGVLYVSSGQYGAPLLPTSFTEEDIRFVARCARHETRMVEIDLSTLMEQYQCSKVKVAS